MHGSLQCQALQFSYTFSLPISSPFQIDETVEISPNGCCCCCCWPPFCRFLFELPPGARKTEGGSRAPCCPSTEGGARASPPSFQSFVGCGLGGKEGFCGLLALLKLRPSSKSLSRLLRLFSTSRSVSGLSDRPVEKPEMLPFTADPTPADRRIAP